MLMNEKSDWKIIVCVTYYQLILAVQMRLTILKKQKITLIIHAGKTNGFDKVYDCLKRLNLFNETFYVRNEDIDPTKGILFGLRRGIQMITGNKRYSAILQHEYNEIIFYNVSTFIQILYSNLAKKNANIICSRMEEGIKSYFDLYSYGKRGLFARRIRRFLKKPNLLDIKGNFYCTIPKLVVSDFELVNIPLFSQNTDELRIILNDIFDYKASEMKQKYIFFASTAAENADMMQKESDFIIEFANKIGRENLLVKMHPRDIRDIYEKNGIATLKNSYIPWEVMQLNLNPKNHVLMTVTSGAFLNIAACMDNIEGYFTYQCLDDDYQAILSEYILHISNVLDKLHSMGLCNRITAINKEVFQNLLSKDG